MSDQIKIDRIIKSRRRTVGLEITADARLIVRAPLRATIREITEIVEQKSRWIRSKIREMNHRKNNQPEWLFIEGEEHYILGKKYPIVFTEDTPNLFSFLNDRFVIHAKAQHYAHSLFRRWYFHQAGHYILKRAQCWADRTGLHFNTCRLSKAQKRWGSCSSKRNINFSWRLILLDPDLIDYIIVHELAHLEHLNHSRKYWAKVNSVYPGFIEQEKKLKAFSFILDF